MRLVFLYHPVKNLQESVSFYKETLGFEEAWREGEHTVALSLPHSDVRLLLEDDEQELTAGGVFAVENVDQFYRENINRLEFVKIPVDIPPGRYAVCKDKAGNVLRIIDFSNDGN